MITIKNNQTLNHNATKQSLKLTEGWDKFIFEDNKQVYLHLSIIELVCRFDLGVVEWAEVNEGHKFALLVDYFVGLSYF